MQIAYRSRNVTIGSGQRQRMEERLGHLSKFLDGIDKAEIALYEEKNPRIAEREVCEVSMYGHGHVVRAKGSGLEMMEAFDKVVDKLEHRLEKLKGKLLSRSHPHHRHDGTKDIFNGNGTHRGPVKTKMFKIESMTTAEAVLHMELLSHSFYFFTNEETGSPAVVYERSDGTVGLIDSEVSV